MEEFAKFSWIRIYLDTVYLGSVWIGLILLKLKIYCWNHCSKIIFKCVNSAVGPIFNEKIDKKWNLWVRKQYTDVLFTENWSKVAATVHVLYMNSNHNIWSVLREQCIHALFTEPQISFFINFFIKNGSHGTIYTFKNYFATVISAINFQFQKNKSYPNRPYVKLYPSVINKFIAKLFSKI